MDYWWKKIKIKKQNKINMNILTLFLNGTIYVSVQRFTTSRQYLKIFLTA
jgi:hypothetical protein